MKLGSTKPHLFQEDGTWAAQARQPLTSFRAMTARGYKKPKKAYKALLVMLKEHGDI